MKKTFGKNKIVVVDQNGNCIYPDSSRDSGVDPGSKIDQKSSSTLKSTKFKGSSKQLRRMRKMANLRTDETVKLQILKPKFRNTATQTNRESYPKCLCTENRNLSESAHSIGDSKSFERLYSKNKPEDKSHQTFVLLVAAAIIFIFFAIYLWGISISGQLIRILPSLLLKKKKMSQSAMIFKYVKQIFGRWTLTILFIF